MVRAGIVDHPSEWEFCGYNEIRKPKEKYALIDHEALKDMPGFKKMGDLSIAYQGWIDESLKITNHCRVGRWSESIAAASKTFVPATKVLLPSGNQEYIRFP